MNKIFAILVILLVIMATCVEMNQKRDVYITMPSGGVKVYTVKEIDITRENWGKTTRIWLENGSYEIVVPSENVIITSHKE